MGKKKKLKRFSVLAIIEGEKRETNFLKFLQELYLDEAVISFKNPPIYGGSPDRLIGSAIKQLHYGFNRIFVWIDEDTIINHESRESLFKAWRITEEQKKDFFNCPLGYLHQRYNEPQQRNPIIIVSQPICVEALILRVLNRAPCHSAIAPEIIQRQKKELKSSLAGLLGKTDEYKYYQENLTKEYLEIQRTKIKELDLLISMLRKPN